MSTVYELAYGLAFGITGGYCFFLLFKAWNPPGKKEQSCCDKLLFCEERLHRAESRLHQIVPVNEEQSKLLWRAIMDVQGALEAVQS